MPNHLSSSLLVVFKNLFRQLEAQVGFLTTYAATILGFFGMLLKNTWQQYRANFKTALVFALLLVFVPVFALFQNMFLSSGTIFVDYGLFLAPPLFLAAEAALIVLLLAFYSFFVSIIVFGVRKNLSKLKLQFYLAEMIQKLTVRIFVFYILYCLLLFLLTVGLLAAGFHVFYSAVAMLLVSFLLLFVPQAVVIDEEGLRHAVLSNFEFLGKHPKSFITVLVVGAVLLGLLLLLEFLVAQLTLLAPYLSLLLSLVFVLPFLETMKTYQYMMRFDLIKEHEAARQKKPLAPRPEPESLAAAPKPK
jgi:hypothetical protein